MTSVKIIALIFVIFALVKMLVVFIDPASWKSVVKKIYVKPIYTITISLISAAVILRFLLQEITIVQIFASMTFMMVLMMVQFAALGNEVVEITEKFLDNKNLIKKLWLSLTLWILLMGWVLYELFV
jgi:hypothetical protein